MKVEIEICTNAEWLNLIQLCENNSFKPEDLSSIYFDKVHNYLIDSGLFNHADIIPNKNQRCMFHGWNGAKFKFRAGGIGTFHSLKQDRKRICYDAHYSAIDYIQQIV